MNAKNYDLEKIRTLLIQLRDHLSHSLHEASEEVKTYDESKGYSQHQADEGTDDFERTISLNLTNNEREVLRQVERALEKIDEGTYGVCDITGKEIPAKRLEVVPYAIMTVEAQEQYEKGLL